jgi:hypothetical protein
LKRAKQAFALFTVIALSVGCAHGQTVAARTAINAVGLGTGLTYRVLKTAYVNHANQLIDELVASGGTEADFDARMAPWNECVGLLDSLSELLVSGESIVERMEAGSATMTDLRGWLNDAVGAANSFVTALRALGITPPSQITAAITLMQSLYGTR